MSDDLGREGWQRRWEQVLVEHAAMLADKPPHDFLLAEATGLSPGRALDAGCGHGAETLWLANAGWEVTAVDFSAAALDHGRATAASLGLADRISWEEGDLGVWAPEPAAYDLVVCFYVHVAGSVVEMITRLGSGLAPGGTLLLLGHQPVDPATGAPTPAAGQVQVSVAEARAALPNTSWDLQVAEERTRTAAGSGVDAVIRAVRR